MGCCPCFFKKKEEISTNNDVNCQIDVERKKFTPSSSKHLEEKQNQNVTRFNSIKSDNEKKDELNIFGYLKGKQGADLFYFLSTQQISFLYILKELVEQPQLYQIRLDKKNQLTANGAMSLITKNSKDQCVNISINSLSRYSSAFYKSESTQRFHFGVVLQNEFTINEVGGDLYSFKYCLLHSFVTQTNTIVALEFKNDSNFSKELGAIVSSDSGRYITTDEQISDPSATAEVLKQFIDSVFDMPFKIKGKFNCLRFQAYLNYLLSRQRNTEADIDDVYNEFIQDLPFEVKQLYKQ